MQGISILSLSTHVPLLAFLCSPVYTASIDVITPYCITDAKTCATNSGTGPPILSDSIGF